MKFFLAYLLKSVPEGTVLSKPLPPHMTIVPPVDSANYTQDEQLYIAVNNALRHCTPIRLMGRRIGMLGPNNDIPARLIMPNNDMLALRNSLAAIIGYSFDEAAKLGYTLPFHIVLIDGKPGRHINRYMRSISLLVKDPASGLYVVQKNFKLN